MLHWTGFAGSKNIKSENEGKSVLNFNEQLFNTAHNFTIIYADLQFRSNKKCLTCKPIRIRVMLTSSILLRICESIVYPCLPWIILKRKNVGPV